MREPTIMGLLSKLKGVGKTIDWMGGGHDGKRARRKISPKMGDKNISRWVRQKSASLITDMTFQVEPFPPSKYQHESVQKG